MRRLGWEWWLFLIVVLLAAYILFRGEPKVTTLVEATPTRLPIRVIDTPMPLLPATVTPTLVQR